MIDCLNPHCNLPPEARSKLTAPADRLRRHMLNYLWFVCAQADWGPSGGRAAAAPSYGEAEAEEEGSKSMVLTTHTIMKVSPCGGMYHIYMPHLTKPGFLQLYCCTLYSLPQTHGSTAMESHAVVLRIFVFFR